MSTALVEQRQELLGMRRELRLLQERVRQLEQLGKAPNRAPTGNRPPSWREAHADEIRAHAGRYVAWGDQGIVASAGDYSALLEELNRLGNPPGLGIEFVPKAPRIRR